MDERQQIVGYLLTLAALRTGSLEQTDRTIELAGGGIEAREANNLLNVARWSLLTLLEQLFRLLLQTRTLARAGGECEKQLIARRNRRAFHQSARSVYVALPNVKLRELQARGVIGRIVGNRRAEKHHGLTELLLPNV